MVGFKLGKFRFNIIISKHNPRSTLNFEQIHPMEVALEKHKTVWYR